MSPQACRAAGCTARRTIAFHDLSVCTFPLKHVHCGNAVTIGVASCPALRSPHSQLVHYTFSESRRTCRG
jgi:hypothetical protein